MKLKNQLRDFLRWLQKYSLKGLKGVAEDTYMEDGEYKTVSEEMTYLGEQMRKSVERGDQDHFTICKDAYRKLFEQINIKISTIEMRDITQLYMEDGYEELDAQKAALDHLWGSPKMSYWLPAKAELINPETGEKVFIVANERHIPPECLYVLTTELEDIKDSGINPWEYVRNRKAA